MYFKSSTIYQKKFSISSSFPSHGMIFVGGVRWAFCRGTIKKSFLLFNIRISILFQHFLVRFSMLKIYLFIFLFSSTFYLLYLVLLFSTFSSYILSYYIMKDFLIYIYISIIVKVNIYNNKKRWKEINDHLRIHRRELNKH